MSHRNYLGGLRKELHYVKVSGDEGSYEPTMVILSHTKPGRSFMIPMPAIWKYVDPIQYKDDDAAVKDDWEQFNLIALKAKRMSQGHSESGIICFIPDNKYVREGSDNVQACQFAYTFHKGTGIMLCTSYNLAKCMQMFEIEMIPQAAAQLLLWIQNELDDLKNMPVCPEEEYRRTVGEATMSINGKKITQEIIVDESNICEQGQLVE